MKKDRVRSVLVTGGAGFIGSHLCERLLSAGHTVTAIDDLSTGSIENIKHLQAHEGFQFVRDSVLNELVMDRLVSEASTVVHLAAAVGVQLIVERPVHTIQTNVAGTEVVLEVAHRYGAKVLLASTSEVYGKGARIPFAEDDDVLLGSTAKSRWAYAASKMIDEFLGLAYHREHALQVVCFRLFNTVGPRQTGHYGMVIPRFVKAGLAGEPIQVFGDGTQSRCFCDVSDVVRAIHGLMEAPDAVGRVFNIGGHEEISILGLAERVRALTGNKSEIRMVPYSEAYAPGFEDMQRRQPDTSRIEAAIGWRPELDLDATLRRVQSWMLESRRS
jgi:UDP-glucose 4-epimerase